MKEGVLGGQRRLEFPGVGVTGGPEAAGDRCCTMNCTLMLEQQVLLANEQYHRPKWFYFMQWWYGVPSRNLFKHDMLILSDARSLEQ